MKETNVSLAALFKSTRKFHRLQQTEFATILGVTQGTISKIESASMSPELGLWFKFLRAFNIQDPYCFTYMGLDFDESAFKNLESEGAALAPTFQFKKDNMICNVRKLRPLFDYLMANNTKPFENFLKSNKISKEIFYILNHPLTADIVDMFFSYLSENKINEKSISMLPLNFEHALGREMKDLNSSQSYNEVFAIINSAHQRTLSYQSGNEKGEYFATITDPTSTAAKMVNYDLVKNYSLLYPYLYLKSAKNTHLSNPVIREMIKDEKWQITYVS